MADAREKSLENYRRKLVEHRELEAKLKKVREDEKKLNKDYEKSENDLKALQSVGQIVGEVLKQLTEEKFIVKVSFFLEILKTIFFEIFKIFFLNLEILKTIIFLNLYKSYKIFFSKFRHCKDQFLKFAFFFVRNFYFEDIRISFTLKVFLTKF